MFIYQFNRLIRSRLLWGTFAVVVALAFIGVPVAERIDRRAEEGPVLGTIGRRRVRRHEFDRVRYFIETVERARRDSLDADAIERQTWQQLAAMEAARKLGLLATDAEVGRIIRQDPAFQEQGRFHRGRYQAILRHQLGIEPATYEEFTKERLTLGKMADLLNAAAWVPPSTVRDQVQTMTDRFTLSYTVVSNRFAAADMPVDEDAKLAYYEENREFFRLPDRLAVRYAEFAITNHLAKVTVDPDEAREYYENMAHRYMRPGTNRVEETIPFAEVEDEIVSTLQLEKARFAAMAAAMQLLEKIDRDPRRDALEWHAPEMGATVRTSGLFYAGQIVPGIDAGPEFSEAAFDLDPSRQDRRFSDTIMGDAHVYVAGIYSNAPSAIQPFSDVRETTRRAVLGDIRRQAFDEALESLYTNVVAALTQATPFADAVAEAGLPPPTNVVFTAIDAFQDDRPHAAALTRAIAGLREENLARPERIPNGALLVYVEAHEPGDPLSAEMLRGEILQQLKHYRSEPLFQHWMQWNLEKIGDLRQASSSRRSDPFEGDDFERWDDSP